MKPLLIDFDGVLRLGNKPAPSIQNFFNFLKKDNIPSCIISNSTLLIQDDLRNFLIKNNIETDIPILTAADSTLKYVKDKYQSASVYCSEKIKKIFRDIPDSNSPEAVVIGDLGTEINAEVMNEMFNKIYNGADLIAMHKNRFWKSSDKEMVLDAGAFITGLEYASGKEAILIGKPSPLYFKNALELINANQNESFMMLGDDLETDIKAANRLGAFTMLVLTGKAKVEDIEQSNIIPHYIVTDLNEAIIALSK